MMLILLITEGFNDFCSLSPDLMQVHHLGTAVSSDFTQIESTSNAYFRPKTDWIKNMINDGDGLSIQMLTNNAKGDGLNVLRHST